MVLSTRGQKFKDDINRLFKNSMITGIPQIIEAGNRKKKLVRSLVFVICVMGFIYQTLAFMRVYWKYETVVDVQMYSPMEIDRPAFTVCGENGFMSSKFCPTISEEFTMKTGVKCEKVENNLYTDYCFCHPRLCTREKGLKNISFIRDDGFGWIHQQPWDWVKQFMASTEHYIYTCEELHVNLDLDIRYCKSSDSVTVPCHTSSRYPMSCFTRGSLYGDPDSEPERVLPFGGVRLDLFMLENELPETIKEPRMFISFHTPYTIQNPRTDGFILEKSHAYQFRLSKVIKKLLPFPYETDCVDYLETWKARGGKGPTTVNECIQECMRNRSLEVHGCLMSEINYPGYDQHCQLGVSDSSLITSSQECIKNKCKPACYEEYYVTTADGSENPHERPCVRPELHLPELDLTSVEIHYSGMVTTVYVYSPKYKDIEIFSYIGGYIGMWLGISLIAVFDFLETVVTLMQIPLRRIRQKKQKNTVTQFNEKTMTVY